MHWGSVQAVRPIGGVEVQVKVKCTVVHALRLCTGRTAHRGSWGIALFFLDHGIRNGRGVSVTPRPIFTPGKDPVTIVQEAGWAPGPVCTGAENLAPTGIRSRTVYPVASRYTEPLLSPHITEILRDFTKSLSQTGDRGSTVVKVLCYKSEGRWFDPSWCQWIFHWHIILPIALWGRLSL